MTRPGVGESAAALHARLGHDPDVLIVLGSGLAALAESIDDATVVDFADVPGYPDTSVPGHTGRYVFGRLGGKGVLLQVGRFHAYEGHPIDAVVAPVRVASALGIETMIVTNAAGGLTVRTPPGSLVLLDDHINLTFRSPLKGELREREQRFPDMSRPFDEALQELATQAAAARGVGLERGVYAGVLGPSYETAAEVRMLAMLGADVVGMSTVLEVITARALGIRVLGFSVVTNAATGLVPGGGVLGHDEVLEAAKVASVGLGAIVEDVLLGLE